MLPRAPLDMLVGRLCAPSPGLPLTPVPPPHNTTLLPQQDAAAALNGLTQGAHALDGKEQLAAVAPVSEVDSFGGRLNAILTSDMSLVRRMDKAQLKVVAGVWLSGATLWCINGTAVSYLLR